MNDHATKAAAVGKPILLEEFGFPRDGDSFDPAAPTTLRDQYFQEIYALVQSLIPTTPMAGIMPWAWAGDARPPRPGGLWKPGDPFIGDPPHEEQGWYSVYDKDTTLKLITEWSPRIAGTAVTCVAAIRLALAAVWAAPAAGLGARGATLCVWFAGRRARLPREAAVGRDVAAHVQTLPGCRRARRAGVAGQARAFAGELVVTNATGSRGQRR